MQLIPVPADKVINVLPHIQKMLQAALKYSDFTEDQMLGTLQAGLLLLILGRKDNRCVGFTIFKLEGENIHIVLMNSLEGASLSPYFDKLLKKEGAQSLTFTSSRKGWERRAPQLGFEHYATIYKKWL